MSPKNNEPEYPHFVYIRFTPGFAEVDYTTYPSGPFELNVPLQALEQEALAKDAVVVIQAALVPVAEFFHQEDTPGLEEAQDEQQEN